MVLGFKKQFVSKILDGTKVHTIREDKHDRWRPGMKIHFATGVRTSYYSQFYADFCVSTQRIHFKPTIEFADGTTHEPALPHIYVDGLWIIDPKKRLQLALNDGFSSLDDLYTFFHDGFEGKIIHWTNYKY